MPSHLRFQSQPWTTHHVVSLCIQGFIFLKPTHQIKAKTKGVLAYSLEAWRATLFISPISKASSINEADGVE